MSSSLDLLPILGKVRRMAHNIQGLLLKLAVREETPDEQICADGARTKTTSLTEDLDRKPWKPQIGVGKAHTEI